MTLRAIGSSEFELTASFRTREGSRVVRERDRAEEQAWSALAQYKFWMFGYHAAQWVLLNRVADKRDRRSNPFRALVLAARQRDRVASAFEMPSAGKDGERR